MTPRLKSLELHGYKTFASKTDFEFPGVITAVVGPNGSGKSNIADALRWVLGEQSYSLLRGRKTEDMIFSGSEQRPRAGMASATITFDNSDNWLPIDYSEVAITRRAYRDGQNEYLLNGQRVRLKEISELLAQSGLAERTYTIIGQGLVDAALSLKPEERRGFFEEAAGIGLYRTRKEDSLNRLDATRRNLERVHDIIAELEPRLVSLEKQAKRALEYDRVKADLRLLLRDWYGYHWNRMIQDVAKSQEIARLNEQRQQQAREKLSQVETHLDEKHREVSIMREQLNTWHDESSRRHLEREKVSRELAVLDERQRALTTQLQILATNEVQVDEEQAERKLRLDQLQQEKTRIENELNEAKAQVENARGAFLERQKAREKIEFEVRQERRKLVDVETRLIQNKAKNDEFRNRREAISASVVNIQNALVKNENAITESEKRFEQAKQERAGIELEIKQLEQAVADQRRLITEKEIERKTLTDAATKLNARLAAMKAQLDVLKQAESSASGLNRGTKLVLDSHRAGKLSGRIRAFSSMIEVPAEYELAAAAALGEFLDGVIFGDDFEIDPALSLFEVGEKGRTVLVPEGVKTRKATKSIDAEGCIGPILKFIKVANGYEDVIGLLLSDVMLVDSRQNAQKLQKSVAETVKLVTLKGEVFWGNGVISAGQEGRSGVIARPRQQRELETSIEAAQVENKQNDEKISASEQHIGVLQRELRDREAKNRQLNQEQSRAVQTFQQANLVLEQVKQNLNWSRNQLNENNERLKKTAGEIETIESEIRHLEKNIQAQNDLIREKNRALSNLPMDDLQRQVVHWETNAAVSARMFTDLVKRLEEQQRINQAGVSQAQALREKIQYTKTQQDESARQTELLHEKEEQISASLDELMVQIKPTESALAGLEADYSSLQGDHLAAQQAMTLADRMNTQAQLELSRNREAMDALKRRIEDDFGLVAFDYNTEVSGQTPLPFEGMVEQLPVITQLPQEFEENISRQRSLLRRMGAINPDAQHEYREVKERYEFLKSQVEDLQKADLDLRQVIVELDELMQREFMITFTAVAAEFKKNFTRLFGGGSAQLVLMDEEHPAEGGIDIEARLPGRREQGLSLLSGGERSLTAVALIFSLLRVSPTPFCVMDEVDAMLDEANVGRFRDLLQELSADTQFIIITHNRNTVQAADVIYGVTMGRDSASQIISLKLDEVSEDMAK